MDLFAAIVVWLFGTASECEYEDGSTQAVCAWDGGANGEGYNTLNLGFGAVSIRIHEDNSIEFI